MYGDWALALGLAVLFQIEVWTIDPSHPPGDVGTEVFSSAERAFAAAAGDDSEARGRQHDRGNQQKLHRELSLGRVRDDTDARRPRLRRRRSLS